MTAPYAMTERGDGSFDLTAAAGGPAPTADELALAVAIERRLRALREHRDKVADPAGFAAALRSAARTGLTGEGPRDVAAATGSLPPDPDPAPGPAAAQEPAPGQFRVFYDGSELRAERMPNTPEPSDEQRKFLAELLQQERLIRALYCRGVRGGRKPPALEVSMNGLAGAASLGLSDRVPDVALARLAIQGILADAIQENAARVRGAYLWGLARSYVVACAVIVGLTYLYFWGTRRIGASPPFLLPAELLAMMDVALLSLAVGGWLVAAFRLQPDSPEILASLFATTSSAIRVLLVLGFGFIGLLFFYKQVIVFSFGPSDGSAGAFTTAQVFSKLSAAVLAGGLLGLSDAALPSAVIARSANLVAALAPR